MSEKTATLSSTPRILGKPNGPGLFHVKGLKLPNYIEQIAGSIHDGGKPLSEAVQLAVGACERWASGRGDVRPEVRKAAAKAIAEWEKAKATAHATKSGKSGGSSKKVAAAHPLELATKTPPFTDPKSGSTTVSKTDAADPRVKAMAQKLTAKGYDEERAWKVATFVIRRRKGANGGQKVAASQPLALAQGPSCKCGGPHDCVFYANRSTPAVVHPGDAAPQKNGYGRVVKRRKATDSEEKAIRAGRWIRVDAHDNKPGDTAYQKTRLRPQLVNAAQPADPSALALAGQPTEVAQARKTGGMVALVPSETDAQKLAVDHDQAETPDKLHVTLHYLGPDVTGWDEQRANDVLAAAKNTADSMGGPVTARAWAHASFNPDGGPGGDRDPCAVYLIGDASSPGRDKQQARYEAEAKKDGVSPARMYRSDPIQDAHQDLKGRMGHVLGDYAHEQHRPFVPHVTAGYGMGAQDLSHTGPVTFDRLQVHLGGKVHEFPLREQPDPARRGRAVAAAQPAGTARLALAATEIADSGSGPAVTTNSTSSAPSNPGARGKFPKAKRQRMARSGAAMKDGSFPIEDASDVKAAVRAESLTTKAKPPVRAHIVKRANAVGGLKHIPPHWKAKATA